MLARKSGLIAVSVALGLTLAVAAIHARDVAVAERAGAPQATPAVDHAQRASATLEERSHLTVGLSRGEFEHELRERFLGTYRLYQTLNEEAKGEVYDYYRNNNTIATIRRLVAYSL